MSPRAPMPFVRPADRARVRSPFPRSAPAHPLHPHPQAPLPELPPPAICLALTKDDRRRRYWIRPAPKSQEWYAQIFYGDLQHRGLVGTYHDAERAYAEFTREIADALLDGWTIVTE